jgi:hypothetical protein
MERRSTVSGPTAPSTHVATNGFPPPLPPMNYPSTRSVSPDRMASSVIGRAQTSMHRAQTQTSTGRRPLPSIGTRSPPVPPLPGLCHPNHTRRFHSYAISFIGSSRSLPVQSSSRSPPVPGNIMKIQAISKFKVIFRKLPFGFLADPPCFRQFTVAYRARYLYVCSIVSAIYLCHKRQGAHVLQIALALHQ